MKPRELRRRVMLPARLHDGAAWRDICILNISSRGLLIQSSRGAAEGSHIELRRGAHVIRARVVWRKGARAGLQSEDRLPVEDIVCQGSEAALQLTAGEAVAVDRRHRPRPPQPDARLRGRAFEFAGVALIGAGLAMAAFSLVEQAMTRPLAAVAGALRP